MRIDGRIRQDISFICEVSVSPRTRVANLWHAEISPWHAASTAVPVCFIPFDRPVSLYCEKFVRVYTHTHTYTYIRTYISDCIEIVCELLLLPNNTASESFLHTSGAVRSVDWLFMIGVHGLAVIGQLYSIGQNDLQFSFQTGSSSSPSYFQNFFLNRIPRKGLY